MPKFGWEARSKAGASQKGTMEATNSSLVEAQLKRYGFTGISVKEQGKGIQFNLNFLGGKKIATVIFTRQFATMIDSGLPLVQCLDILSSQQENKTFKDILLKVKESVESGSTFSDALGKHPKAFDQLYVNLVAAGETVGAPKRTPGWRADHGRQYRRETVYRRE